METNNNTQFEGQNNGQTIIIKQVEAPSNKIGTAGFVLALIAFFFSWIPVMGWLIWALGAIFSLIGLSRAPKGLAVTGVIISFIGLIILLCVVGTIGILASL